jgi:hypothetical protein
MKKLMMIALLGSSVAAQVSAVDIDLVISDYAKFVYLANMCDQQQRSVGADAEKNCKNFHDAANYFLTIVNDVAVQKKYEQEQLLKEQLVLLANELMGEVAPENPEVTIQELINESKELNETKEESVN